MRLFDYIALCLMAAAIAVGGAHVITEAIQNIWPQCLFDPNAAVPIICHSGLTP